MRLGSNDAGDCVKNPCARMLGESIPIFAAMSEVIKVETAANFLASSVIIDRFPFALPSNAGKAKDKLTLPGMEEQDAIDLITSWDSVVLSVIKHLYQRRKVALIAWGKNARQWNVLQQLDPHPNLIHFPNADHPHKMLMGYYKPSQLSNLAKTYEEIFELLGGKVFKSEKLWLTAQPIRRY